MKWDVVRTEAASDRVDVAAAVKRAEDVVWEDKLRGQYHPSPKGLAQARSFGFANRGPGSSNYLAIR